MKRKRLLLLAGLVLVGVALALSVGLPLLRSLGASRRITAANFAALHPGMPRPDVGAVLGAGNARRARPLPGGGVQVDYLEPDSSGLSPGDLIRLDFDSQGRLSNKQLYQVTVGEVLTNLRRNWFGF